MPESTIIGLVAIPLVILIVIAVYLINKPVREQQRVNKKEVDRLLMPEELLTQRHRPD